MPSEARRRSRHRGMLRKTRLPLVVLLVASLLGLASSTPAAEAQQQPTPPRPLLLVAGTFAPDDHDLFLDPSTGAVPWLEEEGGYTYHDPNNPDPDADLFVIELASPSLNSDDPPKPSNWPGPALIDKPGELDYYVPSWGTFTSFLASDNVGGSPAGLASLQDSADVVEYTVQIILGLTQQSEIDIIGHSQGATAARKYIRDAGQSNPVNTMISLGGGTAGIPASWEGIPPVFFGIFNWWSDNFMADCRDNNWLPVCPDMIYTNGPNDTPNDVIPNLNAPADPGDPNDLGPVPQPTSFFHFYSTLFVEDGDPIVGSEAVELPNESNVYNGSVQDFCLAIYPNEPERYVHHIDEFQDPALREMMVWGLNIRAPDWSVCEDQH